MSLNDSYEFVPGLAAGLARARAEDAAGDRGYPAPRRVIDTDTYSVPAWTVQWVG